jgi:hypothetical protein
MTGTKALTTGLRAGELAHELGASALSSAHSPPDPEDPYGRGVRKEELSGVVPPGEGAFWNIGSSCVALSVLLRAVERDITSASAEVVNKRGIALVVPSSFFGWLERESCPKASAFEAEPGCCLLLCS